MPPSVPTIQILPPELTTLIAAGEVVDRPASVVKELVENALDAKATAISVEVEEGGLRHIRVSDNGCGITRADAALAPHPFATSKISTISDLSTIHTYGFRGEALSSLTAVAQVEILTRTHGELEGTRVLCQPQPGEVANIQTTPAASPVGTRISVTSLFANTPARRKFLKAPLRELTLLQQIIERYALSHPQVAFRLVADGRPRLTLPPGSLLERIGAIYGREAADEMLAFNWQALDLRIEGFASRPTIARSRRDRQIFCVNGRPIRSGLLAVMLERPYAGRLPPGRYPLAVVHISLDPQFIDVNVHPQKSEIRFSRERRVYSAVSQAIHEVLAAFPQTVFAEDGVIFPWPFAGADSESFLSQSGSLHESKEAYEVSTLRPLAQIHQTYILAQTADTVLIIDQHAAHEQILYEACSHNTIETVDIPTQHLSLTTTDVDLLAEHQPLFTALGFGLESFGRQSYTLRALPAQLQPYLHNQIAHTSLSLEAHLINTLIEELATCKQETFDLQRDKLAQKAACVCAIKAGDVLSEAEMQQLLQELMAIWSPAACPHGRPVFVPLSLAEIERRFGRRS